MQTRFKYALAVAAVAMAGQAMAQVTFYERDNFQGRSFTTDRPVGNFDRFDFNDRASSIVVVGQTWEACENANFSGRCVVLRPGRYPSLNAMGMNNRISSVRAVIAEVRVEPVPVPAPAPENPRVIFYSREGFEGRSFMMDRPTLDLNREGFNDRASSVVVVGGRWEACSDAEFRGRCVVLRPGRYPSLAAMGIDNSISSVRIVRRDVVVEERPYAPPPLPVYDSRPRNDERLYQVNISSVRAVMGPPEQRCWVEREPVAQPRSNANVGGAIAGALIGGILGHQVGGGLGKDIATAGGAVAGGVVGSRLGSDNRPQSQDVQRCAPSANQAPPAYWDVAYVFRGQEHHVQMSAQPGPTIVVNEQGEPRT